MTKKFLVTLLVIASAAIAGLLIGSQFPAYGQTGLVGGSYQVSLVPASNPSLEGIVYLATLGSEGSIMGTVPPLACLPPNASLSTGHGTWGIGVTTAGPRIRFQMLSALYLSGQFQGFVEILGEAPVPVGAEVHGTTTLSFPAAISDCGEIFNGDAAFTAVAIPPVPIKLP